MLVSTAVRETVEPLTDAFGPIAWTAPLLTSSEPLFVTAGWVTVGGGASLCCTRMPSCGAVSRHGGSACPTPTASEGPLAGSGARPPGGDHRSGFAGRAYLGAVLHDLTPGVRAFP